MREPFPGYPPPLTTRPEGLLDLLGLQNNGAYPQHLAYQQLVPTLDLLRWYLEAQADFINTTVTCNASGFHTGTDLTVPNGEHWILLAATATGSGGATIQTVAFARTNSSGGSVLALGPSATQPAASTVLLARTDDVGPWLIRPSVQLGLFCQNAAGGSVIYTVTLRVARLKT